MCEHLLLNQPESKWNELNYPRRPTSEELVPHPTPKVVPALTSIEPEKCQEDGLEEEELEVTTVIQVQKSEKTC